VEDCVFDRFLRHVEPKCIFNMTLLPPKKPVLNCISHNVFVYFIAPQLLVAEHNISLRSAEVCEVNYVYGIWHMPVYSIFMKWKELSSLDDSDQAIAVQRSWSDHVLVCNWSILSRMKLLFNSEAVISYQWDSETDVQCGHYLALKSRLEFHRLFLL